MRTLSEKTLARLEEVRATIEHDAIFEVVQVDFEEDSALCRVTPHDGSRPMLLLVAEKYRKDQRPRLCLVQ